MTGTPWQARRNLRGNPTLIEVHGDDVQLNDLLDRLEYCSGMEVVGRRDKTAETGILFVQTKRVSELINLVKELGLKIGG